MAHNRVELVVEELARPILEELKYELVDIEYKKEGGSWFLRFYIDKPGGITLDDCQIFSERIGELLDHHDPIPHRYYLEVSSPGLDRPLKKDEDFERYKGHRVCVKLYKSVNGEKNYYGQLVGLKDGNVVIQDGECTYSFPRDNVAMVRLDVNI
ncbi:MAG: ribosome maturation factor RimP [Caldicoprobacter sp.]|uniref:ribosome maturation factor RimP n=1 Tax=Caldicoprobacter sp. TaxID=2004500 RepID=UPI001D32A4F2|nr:ribosome maturation factor RimP [Clostridia bacterium]